MGGQTLGGYVNTTELYDPATTLWSAGPAMSALRGLPAAALLANGRVLVAGGTDGTLFFASAQVYDPVANTWSRLVINVVAACFFAGSGHVIWSLAAVMAPASLVGGLVGGKLVNKIKPGVLRAAVVTYGSVLAVYYIVR